MKRIFAILLIITSCLTLFACRRADDAEGEVDVEVQVAEDEPLPASETESAAEPSSEPEPEPEPQSFDTLKTVEAPEPAQSEPAHEEKEAEKLEEFVNPLDPDRLFSNAEMSLPKSERTDSSIVFPETRTLKYAAPPEGGLSFSSADEKRNVAPDGAKLTLKCAYRETDAGRTCDIAEYTDENGNVYKYNGSGKLVQFLPYAPFYAEYRPYSKELERQLVAAAKELAHAIYGDELDAYDEVEYENPEGYDYSCWHSTSVSYVEKREAQTFYRVFVAVYCDFTVSFNAQRTEDPDIDYAVFNDLTKENLMELIGRRVKQDAKSDKVYFPDFGEFVLDFLFEYEGHVYQQVFITVASTDGSDFDRDATRCYYYRVD